MPPGAWLRLCLLGARSGCAGARGSPGSATETRAGESHADSPWLKMKSGFFDEGVPVTYRDSASLAHRASASFDRATGAQLHADVINAMVNAAR
ncbi:hypothetical protein [Ideonella sp. YS5]|uniref:hypothetical protein n=1 Tax=Ideonella sp. YS5 TaxID=3453714 RepID=UPI003EEB020C